MFDPSVAAVFAAALLTAVATGAGALPFLFLSRLSPFAISIANAIAAGLMLAATHALVAEGIALDPGRLILGLLLGLAAIVVSERLVNDRHEVDFASLGGLDTRKAMLLIAVMTAHSFAEGIGIGVAFADTKELATFITAAMAVHNIPEGLAIALVLVPRGVPVLKAAGWAIFSSLPQPVMAVPAFLAVSVFAPLLPVGLGFAAGAMLWVVFAELIPDANRDAAPRAAGIAVTLAFTAMIVFQYLVLKS